MPDAPLTPALAIAALIETKPHPLPHWQQWVADLREWAAQQPVEADQSHADAGLAHGAGDTHESSLGSAFQQQDNTEGDE